MVDNTVVINDSCVGTDHPTLIIKQTIPEDNFNPRNLLMANFSDAGNSRGDLTDITTSFSSPVTESLTIDLSTSLIGNKSIKCTITNGGNTFGGFRSQNIPISSGTTITFSAWIKSVVSGNRGQGILIDWYNGSTYISSSINQIITTSINEWTKFTVTGTAPVNTTRCLAIIRMNVPVTNDIIWLGGAQLELGDTASPWMPGNLLTYNQQTVETDLTGISSWKGTGVTTTLSRTTETSYKGIASGKLEVITKTEGACYFQFTMVSPTLKAGKTYMMSAKVKYVKNNHNKAIVNYLTLPVDGANNFSSQKNPSGDWDYHNFIFTPSYDQTMNIAITANGLHGNSNVEVGDKLYYDEAWLIEYPTDNISIRNQLSVPEIQGNLLKPNCATGGDVLNSTLGMAQNNGTLSRDTTTMHNGTGSCKVTCNYSVFNTNIYPQLNIPVKPNTQYTASVWTKTDNINDVLTLGIYYYKSNGAYITSSWGSNTSAPDWIKLTLTFTTPAECSVINFAVNNQSLTLGKSIWIDEAQLEEGSVRTDWKYPSIGPVADKPSVTVKPTLRDTKKSKNMLEPNVATGGDNNNSAFLFGNNNGPEIRTRDLSTMVQGSGSILCTMTATVGYQGLYAIFYNENNITTSTISCLPNTDYTFSAYVKVQSGKGLVLDLRTKSSTSVYVHNYYHYIGTGEWDRISITVNSGSNIGLSCLLTKENALVEAISFNTDCWQLEEGNIATEWEYPGAVDTNNIITTTNTNDTITTQETIKNTTNLILQEYSDVIQETLQTSCPIFLDDNFSGLEDLNTLSTLSLTEPLTITEETNTYVASGVYETADLSDKIILVNSLKMLEYPEILEDLSLYVHAFIDEDVDVLDKVLHPLLIKDRYVNIETELNEVIKMITEEDITVAFKTDKDVTILVGGKVND